MKSTMIGFGLDESKLQKTVDYIESWLVRYNVPYDHIDGKHISVAMITDKARKDELVRLIHGISKDPLRFKTKRITILYGQEWDFIALELRRSEKFLKLHEKIKENYNVVEFKGGVRPHVSLLKIQKGVASDEFFADVFRGTPVPKDIKSKKVELWSPKFKIDFSKKFQRK